MYWKICTDHAIKRLNIIDYANVNEQFINDMEFICKMKFRNLEILFEDDEWQMLLRNIGLAEKVKLYKVKIPMYIPHCNTYHNEVWIFGNFDDMILSPLKRDSDFTFDIIKFLRVAYHEIE